MSTPPIKPLATRERLSEVRYEIRGELARRARDLEAQGRKLIKLNIGNPGAFGFRAPAHPQRAIIDDIDHTDPYTHQQGLPAAREAIAAAVYIFERHPDDPRGDAAVSRDGLRDDVVTRSAAHPARGRRGVARHADDVAVHRCRLDSPRPASIRANASARSE